MSLLFREQVIEARKQQWLGEILLTRPLSLTFYTATALLIAGAILAGLVFGDYTHRERVVGRIVLEQGVAKIYSPVAGIVVKKLVREGQSVSKGQTLYVISAERITAKGDTQVAIGEEIRRKRENLKGELELKKLASQEDVAALQQKASDLESQLRSLDRETATQTKRLALSERALDRFRELSDAKFVSPSQVAEREQDELDQEARLQSLQRTAMTVQADLAATRSALRSAPLNSKSQLSGIEREISVAVQESYENEARREIAITALQDGLATAVLTETGQTVTPNEPMLSILPANAEFEAHLYVPSRAVGLLRERAKVLMRYEAFPYQKFGQYSGVIKSISRSALAPNELQLLGAAPETLYRVTVTLDTPYVLTYGRKVALQDGMLLEADVLLDTRKLYEWLLEPLYSVTGKM